MHYFKIHAGDFGEGEGSLGSLSGKFTLPVKGKLFKFETVQSTAVERYCIQCALMLASFPTIRHHK